MLRISSTISWGDDEVLYPEVDDEDREDNEEDGEEDEVDDMFLIFIFLVKSLLSYS